MGVVTPEEGLRGGPPGLTLLLVRGLGRSLSEDSVGRAREPPSEPQASRCRSRGDLATRLSPLPCPSVCVPAPTKPQGLVFSLAVCHH